MHNCSHEADMEAQEWPLSYLGYLTVQQGCDRAVNDLAYCRGIRLHKRDFAGN